MPESSSTPSSSSSSSDRPLAVVTGASTGIGLELARCCAEQGFDLLIAADEPQIEAAAQQLRATGCNVEPVQADLSTREGVAKLVEAVRGRPVDALLANAGRGLGNDFLDQDFDAARSVIDTNITGTIELVQRIAKDMRQRGRGRILITGSIAGFMPGSFHAVYNGTKAFIDSFSAALRNELKDSGVTVTCLMPGATATPFFSRAGLLDTKVGTMKKDDPAKVARDGFEAMMKGSGEVVSGWKNKLQVVVSHVTPTPILAAMHRKQAAPGTGKGKGSSSNDSGSPTPMPTPLRLPDTLAAGALGGLAGGAVVSALLMGSEAAGIDNASDMVTMQRRAAGQVGLWHRPTAAPSTPGEEAVGHAWHLALSAGLGMVYAAALRTRPGPAAAKGAGFGLLFFPLAYGLAGPLLGLTQRPSQTAGTTHLRRAAVHTAFGIVTALVTERSAKWLHQRDRKQSQETTRSDLATSPGAGADSGTAWQRAGTTRVRAGMGSAGSDADVRH